MSHFEVAAWNTMLAAHGREMKREEIRRREAGLG
jgi:hypothetical protein